MEIHLKDANLFKRGTVTPTGQNRHQRSLTINEAAVNAIKGAAVAPIDNFGFNVATGAVTAAGATALAGRARRGKSPSIL